VDTNEHEFTSAISIKTDNHTFSQERRCPQFTIVERGQCQITSGLYN
jgi:hypothetical protein